MEKKKKRNQILVKKFILDWYIWNINAFLPLQMIIERYLNVIMNFTLFIFLSNLESLKVWKLIEIFLEFS